MARASNRIFPDIEIPLKTPLLYWLDAEVDTFDDNIILQKQLRSIIQHLKTFNNQNECQKMIESLDEQNQLILIVSGQLGRQLVPQIHQLRQLSSIYVYCMDKSSNEEWAKHFTKVREVIVKLDHLITQIKLAQKSRVEIEESISFNIYIISDNLSASTIALNDNFLHSLLLTNVLLRLESNPKDKQDLISFCKKEYKKDKNQLNIIAEFHETYTPEKALWWYTRESFLYRILNEVLRGVQQHIELLLLFRFFIQDIYKQLKENQYKSSIRVYYSQLMWACDMKYLQDRENSSRQYLSINSFLLTNINRTKLIDFLKHSELSKGQHKVLFIIDANPNVVTTKPFADISRFGHFTDDGEILFMIGCVFRLIDVEHDGQMLIVRLELCGDNEHDLQPLYQSMRKIYEDENDNHQIDFRTFGGILHRMEKYDFAEIIYQHWLAQLPSNDPSLSDVYFALGLVAKDKNDHESSLKSYQKSLDIKKRTDPSDFITIGRLYGCIGEIYRRKENDKEAMKYFQKSMKLFETEHAEDHQYMADFYHNTASIYKRQKKYNDALKFYEKALTIDKKNSSSHSLSVAKSHNSMGIIYCLLNQYDLSMEHNQLSLSIRLKVLPPQHISIAQSHVNIGCVYKMTGDFKAALTHYQKAAIIYRHLLPSQHPDVKQTDNEIQYISKRLR